MKNGIDILMITYNRAQYTKLSLKRLLDTCDESMRVWVWQNGNDEETISVVESFKTHPSFFKYYHSKENKKLIDPINWLWTHSDSDFCSKVDDDCLVPKNWAHQLRLAHQANPDFGAIGCWHYLEEDFDYEISKNKIQTFREGHALLRNCWIGGSGYLLKKKCINEIGPLEYNFTHFCISAAIKGYINGWYYPFLFQEHLDDPRSPNTRLKTDDDVKKWAPLSAINNGCSTIESWKNLLEKDALYLQKAPFDPKYYSGWRSLLKRASKRLKNTIGKKQQW